MWSREGLHCASHFLHLCSNVSQHEEKRLWDEIFKTREEWNQFIARIMPMWGFRRKKKEESRVGVWLPRQSLTTREGESVSTLWARYITPLSRGRLLPAPRCKKTLISKRAIGSLAGNLKIIQSVTFHCKMDHLKGRRRNPLNPLLHPICKFRPKFVIFWPFQLICMEENHFVQLHQICILFIQ